MCKIGFYNNYPQEDPRVKFLFKDFLPQHFINNKWKNLEIDQASYDYLVCFNDYPDWADKNKCITLNIEPPYSTYYSDRAGCFHKTKRAKEPIDWVIHLGVGYTELNSNYNIAKSKDISTIISSHKGHYQQIIRQDFLKYLKEITSIDVYGFGYNTIPIEKKYLGLLDYKYCVKYENHIENFHCTEKLMDCILAETLCFYYGAPNTSSIVDNRAYIPIDLSDFNESLKIISDSIRLNEWERRRKYIIEEKKRLLNEVQLAPRIHKIIYGH